MNGLEKLIEINIIAAHAEKIRQANRKAAQANYYGPEANRLAVYAEGPYEVTAGVYAAEPGYWR
jgi:hypothetical protein